jgi:nucleotide-binding universal stress UspA family protein
MSASGGVTICARRWSMEDVKRILAVSSMTKSSRKAIHYGVSLSKKYGTELYVLHVVYHPFGFDLKGWNLPIPSLEEEYKRIIKEAKEELHAMINKEKKKGLSIKEMIREGKPIKEILKVVKEENIDLIIMLVHSEWRLEHFLFGRIKEEMIRKAPCSILLIKEEPGKIADYDD